VTARWPQFPLREDGDTPRFSSFLMVHTLGYVVSYLEASRERGGARRFGKRLCANNYPAGRAGSVDRDEASLRRSQRAQEFEEGLLFRGFQLSEFFGDVSGLAAVAEDGVEKGDGSAVVHETRMQADAP
jgi:hypothetical protein